MKGIPRCARDDTVKAVMKTVESYIDQSSPDVQKVLSKLRLTIRRAAPDAEESISYGIPTFKVGGKALVYFAAFQAHIGFYPMTAGVRAKFKKELSPYKQSTGTVRFPLDEPLPYPLIGRIVKFKVKEIRANQKRKRSASTR